MQAAGLLAKTPKPEEDEIDVAMNDNLCRCGTYLRIRAAIRRAARTRRSSLLNRRRKLSGPR
jgi:isoquinoline 1-oxidoreductase alpha subunit